MQLRLLKFPKSLLYLAFERRSRHELTRDKKRKRPGDTTICVIQRAEVPQSDRAFCSFCFLRTDKKTPAELVQSFRFRSHSASPRRFSAGGNSDKNSVNLGLLLFIAFSSQPSFVRDRLDC